MMKYLLLEDREQEKQALLDNIAAFLWNNGNEVYSRNNVDHKIDYQTVAKHGDCIVFLIHSDCSEKSLFESGQGGFQQEFDLEKSIDKKLILAFTKHGVYFNAIPSPHKIFHFERLCQNELTRFFYWCEKLNLFAQHPSKSAYQNFLFL